MTYINSYKGQNWLLPTSIKKEKMKIQNKILLVLGIILVLDGILSIIIAFPNSCYHACLNNSIPGQIGRAIRILIGILLIYESFQKRRVI